MQWFSKLRNVLLASAASALLAAPVAQGSLLFYEPFDYTPGENLHGQTFNGTGATGNWTATNLSFHVEISSGSLSFSNLVTNGNSADITGSVTNWITADFTIPANEDTLWTSFLYQGTRTGNNGRVGMRLFEGPGTSGSNALTTFAMQHNSAGIGVQSTGAITTHGTNAIYDGEPYLILTALSNVHATSGTLTAVAWALSEENFDTLVDSGWDVSVLNDSDNFVQRVIRQGQDSAPAPAIGSLWLLTGENPVGIVDELRIGTTLQSVTPIPEPASLAVLGIAATLMLRRRGRSIDP